jgi:hypothetical protein
MLHITDHHLAVARTLGREDAEAAASWAADGNASAEHIQRVLGMLADGDPEAYDYLPPRPDLSGEWADGRTPLSLLDELGIDHSEPLTGADLDELWHAYEDGVDEAFGTACEVELARWLGQDDGAICLYCDAAIRRAADGAWEDESGACGCGDAEHTPATSERRA